jgi:hypothetical protein
LLLAAGMLVALAACTPATAPATPTSPDRTTPTTAIVRVLVTRTPSPTPTLAPTPTFPFDVSRVLGTWTLHVTYTLRDSTRIDSVRFVGSAALEIGLDTAVSTVIEFYPAVSQPPCNTAVLDSAPLTATIDGILHPAADDDPAAGAVIDLRLTPDDPLQETGLWMFCPEFDEPYQISMAMLWPALSATGELAISLPLQAGYREVSTADLSGPTGGGLRGSLVSELRISR